MRSRQLCYQGEGLCQGRGSSSTYLVGLALLAFYSTIAAWHPIILRHAIAKRWLMVTLSWTMPTFGDSRPSLMQFAERLPEEAFTPAEIQGFLLIRKKEPRR